MTKEEELATAEATAETTAEAVQVTPEDLDRLGRAIRATRAILAEPDGKPREGWNVARIAAETGSGERTIWRWLSEDSGPVRSEVAVKALECLRDHVAKVDGGVANASEASEADGSSEVAGG